MNVQYTKWEVPAVMVLFCLCQLAYAGGQGKVPSGVSVRLVGEGDCVVLGDPATLSLTVQNDSESPISFVADAMARHVVPRIDFYVASATQEVFRQVELLGEFSGATKVTAQPKYVTLIGVPSKGRWSFTFCFDYEQRSLNDRVWLFPSPGEYKIKAVLYSPEKEVSGDSVPYDTPLVEIETTVAILNVVASSSRDDLEAFLALGRLTHGWRLYAPGTCAENTADAKDIFRDIREIRESHAKSRFGKYAELCLLHAAFVKALLGKDEEAMGGVRRRCAELGTDKTWSPGWRYKAKDLVEKMDKYVKAIPRISPKNTPNTDQPVPTSVVPKQALPAEDRAAVERVVESFGSSMLSGPEEKCLSLLTDDFLYRQTMTKSEFRKEIRESMKKAKDAETSGRLTVKPTIQEVGLNDQGAVALVVVIAHLNTKVLGEPSKEIWEFAKKSERWQIKAIRLADIR